MWTWGDFRGSHVKLYPSPHKSHLTRIRSGSKMGTKWTQGGCEVTLEVLFQSCPLHHTKSPHVNTRWMRGDIWGVYVELKMDARWLWTQGDFWGVYVELKMDMRWLWGVLFQSCPLHHTKSPCMDTRCMQGDFGCVISKLFPPPHKVTSCGHEVEARWLLGCVCRVEDGCKVDTRWLLVGGVLFQSCPLYHTKSLRVDARWMRGDFGGLFQSCPLHHTKSPCVDTRWAQGDFWGVYAKLKMYARWMRGDFGGGCYFKVVPSTTQSHLTWMRGECEVTLEVLFQSCPSTTQSHLMWMQGGCGGTLEVLFQSCPLHHTKSPRMHMRWLFGCVCQVVPSTTHKSHLMWTFSPCGDILTLCPSCMAPLLAKIISFTSRPKSPKKVTQQLQFHQ